MPGLEGRVLCSRYRVDEYVGGGGMADVYKAWDMQRSCYLALKLMRQSLSDVEELGLRFRREADVLSRLQHPNIVRLYGFEQDEEESLVFIVMDYVDGPTVASKLKVSKNPLPLAEVVTITEDVAAALSYAHNQKICHRDIKPSNIIIARDGRAVLSDFGIARLSDALTMTYHGIGTPAYMSPEQCAGKEADARSDIYSLGVVLYECLVGRRPFLGDLGSGETPTTANIIKEHIELPPPAPTDVNPSLRPELEAVIVKALAKDPQYRYQSAADLARELRVAAGGAVLPALRVSTIPGGAHVYIDRALQGVSPLEVLRLSEGQHEVHITARGFVDHTQSVQIPDQRTLEVRLQSEKPPESTVILAPQVAGAGKGPAVPTWEGSGYFERWRDRWRRHRLKTAVGLGGAGIVAVGLVILIALRSGGGDQKQLAAAGSTSTPTATPAGTTTLTPGRTATKAATATATPKPQPTSVSTTPTVIATLAKKLTITGYAGADASKGVIVNTRAASGLQAGNGLLRIVFKYPDGSIASDVSAAVCVQTQDVNANPVRGDCSGMSQEDDKSYQAELKPGTYALDLNGVRGYSGAWDFGYQVQAGQVTDVTLIVSRLTIVVKNATGGLLHPNVWVYKEKSDVNGKPIQGDQVVSGQIPDEGMIAFNLTPGKYWVEIDVKGQDWGQADNIVAPASLTAAEVQLGRLTYRSTESVSVWVCAQLQDAAGNLTAGDSYASTSVDTNFGAAVFDLTPGTYAVEIGNKDVRYDVQVVAGQTTDLQ